jgi:hypothetical protein
MFLSVVYTCISYGVEARKSIGIGSIVTRLNEQVMLSVRVMERVGSR